MSLRGAFLVTGPSGSGKTTIAHELIRRGYHAISSDKSIGRFVDLDGNPTDKADTTMPDWQDHYKWTFDLDRLLAVLEQYKDSYVYICGSGANRVEIASLFKKIFFLKASPDTLVQRVASRTGLNQMGKLEFQRQAIRERAPRWDSEMVKEGAIFIDAEQPLDAVIAEILEKAAA